MFPDMVTQYYEDFEGRRKKMLKVLPRLSFV